MTIIPAGTVTSKQGPAAWFTGAVQLEEVSPPDSPVRVVQVAFDPGARTAWHTHPHGQLLRISSGVARVQSAGSPVRELKAGDAVWFAPGERHWHGAALAVRMVHLAIQLADDQGVTTTWLEPVSEAEYQG
jgi:quercetin dioxygenase-like cupin family protein